VFLPPGPDLAWRGNYVSLPAATLKAPIEGNRTVPVEISWLKDGAPPSYTVVFNAREQRVTPLSQIAAVHISNIHSSVPVRLLFPDTGFEIELGPALEGYYPVVTNGLEFVVYAPLIPSGTDGVSIQVLNFLPPPLVFGSTPGGTGVAGVSHIDTAAPLAGGPITATGTISLQTPLAIQYGGTGQATPDLALDALAETGGTTSGLLARNSAGNWVMEPLSAGGTPALPMSILNGGTGASTGFLGLDNLTAAGSQTGQLARAANGTWTLSPAGAGTITGVTPGPGIAGGGNAGNVTVALASYVEGYNHAQPVMTGGGNITWGGIGGRLGWSASLMCMPVSSATTASNNLTIDQPTSGTIPAGNTYDGVARTWTAAGIVLTAWEALYAVHTLGGVQSDITFWVAAYTGVSPIASNWILIGTVNGTGGAVKLGTGEFIQPGKTIVSGDQYVSKTGDTMSGNLTIAPAASNAILTVNGPASVQSTIIFSEAGTAKFQIGRHLDNSFFIYDFVNSITALSISPTGTLWLGESGQIQIPYAGPLAPLAVTSVTLSADPTQPLQAATKQYVDARSGFTQAVADPLYVNVTGDTMTGTLVVQSAVQAQVQFLNTVPANTAGGLWRITVGSGGNLNFQQNTAAGDFASGVLTPLFFAPVTGNATFSGNVGALNYQIADGATGAAGVFGFIGGANGPSMIAYGNTSGGQGNMEFRAHNARKMLIADTEIYADVSLLVGGSGNGIPTQAGSVVAGYLATRQLLGFNAVFDGAIWRSIQSGYSAAINHDLGSGNFAIQVTTSSAGDGGAGVSPNTAIIVKPDGSCLNNSGTWGLISDVTVKSDIQPYLRGLDAILALECVAYVYNENAPFKDTDNRVRYGLIADQVKPHIPEACGTFDYNDPEKDEVITLSTLDPGSLTYVLINAIKELKAELDALKAGSN